MSVIGHGVEIVTSGTRPASPFTGQMIYDDTTESFLWYTGSAWVGVTPAGTVNPYAGSSAPPGWLFCYGQTLDSTTNPEYADLFTAIGTTYGGSGASSFIVPDLRGRLAAGLDNMGGSAANRLTSSVLSASNTLGAAGGAQTHTLAAGEMPSHAHSSYHWPDYATTYGNWLRSLVQYGNYGKQPQTSSYAGSSSAHYNTQPTLVLNYIIKY
jgi:microcystin-dependent protein